VRLAAEAECGKNDKGLNGSLHWSVWLYCHKRDKGRLNLQWLPQTLLAYFEAFE